MGVFSYLSFKKPAALLWKAFSPSREIGEDQSNEPDKAEVDDKNTTETDTEHNPRKISEGSTSSGVTDVSGSYLSDSILSSSVEMSGSLGSPAALRLETVRRESQTTDLNKAENSGVLLESTSDRSYSVTDTHPSTMMCRSGRTRVKNGIFKSSSHTEQ